ncbi:DNA-binding response regulator [Siphonobacter sp. BAB-5405]|uniref:LytR/AlgR family response regulator transcription factor n=1 Tax=Siphonobacter sp. BAB-5405 TaxID=1864825 RepID=UPI000C8060D2|nr:LytTR family DNA-binding domain-containing protein [Siphonobacter sp. BAB-5405]PMD90728.1 DNA-binding response regulator [Siphonobacter sp. BAB-5405]
MSKTRCLLVDDEPPALEILESYLEGLDGFEVVASCSNAIQAFRILQEKPVDVLFLDIHMPKLLGTDLLRSLPHPPQVIFTTAHPEFAVDAFDLAAVDYLLKPIAFDRFLRAVAKVERADQKPLPLLAEKEQSVTSQDAFLYFRADRKMVKVFLKNILYIESLKDYVKVITQNEKPLVVKQSMSALEETLPQRKFLRIHRSYLVAIDKIKAYTPTHLEVGGLELPIGRLYQKEVSRALTSSALT